MTALGPRHPEVQQLRTLLRDRSARREAGTSVIEGPRVLEGALDRDAAVEVVYLAPTTQRAFAPLVARVEERGIRIVELKEGVLERIGTTVTPQPVAALVSTALASPETLAATAGDSGPLLVGVALQDPGNVGTILRSAEAAGSAGVLLTEGSVDVFHPKVVRASAGAVYGLPVADAGDATMLLRVLREQGVRTIGTAMTAGSAYDATPLDGQVAIVLGNEGRGIAPDVGAELDAWVHVPMAANAESLNVGVVASILVFESARQRRTRAGRGPGPDAAARAESPR